MCPTCTGFLAYEVLTIPNAHLASKAAVLQQGHALSKYIDVYDWDQHHVRTWNHFLVANHHSSLTIVYYNYSFFYVDASPNYSFGSDIMISLSTQTSRKWSTSEPDSVSVASSDAVVSDTFYTWHEMGRWCLQIVLTTSSKRAVFTNMLYVNFDDLCLVTSAIRLPVV